MRAIDSDYPPGTIAVVSNDVGRTSRFYPALEQLEVPRETRLVWATGCYVHHNRNLAVEQMTGDWLLFLDDDNLFAPDLAMRLLAHRQPIVGSLYVRKQYPFGAHVYDLTPIEQDGVTKRCWTSRALNTIQHNQLIAVDGVATSGLMIQKPVFEKIGPWPFNFGPDGLIGEDLWFCHRAKQMGYDIMVDTGAILGHMATLPVWPVPQADGTSWKIGLEVGSQHETIEIE